MPHGLQLCAKKSKDALKFMLFCVICQCHMNCKFFKTWAWQRDVQNAEWWVGGASWVWFCVSLSEGDTISCGRCIDYTWKYRWYHRTAVTWLIYCGVTVTCDRSIRVVRLWHYGTSATLEGIHVHNTIYSSAVGVDVLWMCYCFWITWCDDVMTMVYSMFTQFGFNFAYSWFAKLKLKFVYSVVVVAVDLSDLACTVFADV